MGHILQLEEVDSTSVLRVGGKGASLGELIRAGLPVPSGFVIDTTAFERYIESAGCGAGIAAALSTIDRTQMHTLVAASKTIHALIYAAPIPPDIAQEILDAFRALGAGFVAVRSSATAEDGSNAAWAGQLDTFLNTTEETLLANVKQCWASLFSPRALFYRFERGFADQPVSIAVVVQTMVPSTVSGIAFSVHPVTEDRNQIAIEAGRGLGEAVVSGQIAPDSYVVSKDLRQIVEKHIAKKERELRRAPQGGNEWVPIPLDRMQEPALSDDLILELADLVMRAEQHYGFPCDIEWAYDNGFFLVQSRPITTLSQP